MTNRLLTLPGLAALLAITCACAGSDKRYPSLELRPFEKGAEATTAAPEAPAPAPPATDPAALALLRDKAVAAHAAFVAKRTGAEELARAAAGQPIESNARGAAMVAMADLSSRRGALAAVLADIDVLAVEAAAALAPDPALASVQAEIVDLLAQEDAAIARLWGIMGS